MTGLYQTIATAARLAAMFLALTFFAVLIMIAAVVIGYELSKRKL